MIKRSKLWSKRISLFHHLQIYEDFVAYLYEQLLSEAEKAHKPTVINYHWFKFKIAQFTHRDLAKGFAVISKVPKVYRPKTIYSIENAFDKDVIDREYEFFIDQNIMGDATLLTFNREVYDFISETYGKEWSLLVGGELTPTDISRLTQMPINLVKRKEKMIFREVIRQFVEKDKVEEMWKEFAVDGTTPLKPSLSVKDEKEKLEVKHWTTLADKANKSLGAPVRENHYERIIRHKKEELARLEQELEGVRNVRITAEETEETTEEPE
jgi:hypothetical protein